MAKIKESDLVIGQEYRLDYSELCTGIYIGSFKSEDSDSGIEYLNFYPTGVKIYAQYKDGTVPFPYCGYEYEEVE